MTDNLLPCPFCGGDARNDAHADDCYFILHKAMVNAPNADISMVPDVLRAWNRRASDAEAAQSLPDGMAQTVYAFRHSSCTHEEAMRVVSLHSKHSDAVNALEAHKSARKAEWDEAYNSVFEDEATAAWCKKWVKRHPWSDEKGSGSECWDTCAMQVDVGVLAASPAQPVQPSDPWLPIETAPENTGELVAVQWLDSDGALIRDLDYTEDGCWMQWHNHAEHVEIIGGHGVSYTPPYAHWMPLPPAPQPKD